MTVTRMTTVSTSVEMGLRFIGMWPGLPYGNFQWFVYMTSVLLIMCGQCTYIVKNYDIDIASDPSVLIDAISITMSYSLAFLKFISLWLNRRLFYEILATMDEDWKEYTAGSRMYPMIIYANLSRRCSNVLISINALAGVFYILGGLLRRPAKDDPHRSRFDLPVKMEFPFEVNQSPIFEITALFQFFHEITFASLAAVINALVVTLVFHVSGQIEIVRQGLIKVSSESYQNSSTVSEMRVLILRHQRIIALSDNIEDLFSWIALMQFLSNTLVICCLGFMIIISIANRQGAVILTKFILFYVAITLEAFVFCFAGEYLSAKSKSIGDAVYQSVWYNMTPSQCRTLLLVIVRSQKRLTISAGKMMDLSLEGFTSVMKASASYISVLHAMY